MVYLTCESLSHGLLREWCFCRRLNSEAYVGCFVRQQQRKQQRIFKQNFEMHQISIFYITFFQTNHYCLEKCDAENRNGSNLIFSFCCIELSLGRSSSGMANSTTPSRTYLTSCSTLHSGESDIRLKPQLNGNPSGMEILAGFKQISGMEWKS